MHIDLKYDEKEFLSLTIEADESEDSDILHSYSQKLLIKNPAKTFSEMAQKGAFDSMSDAEYAIALNKIKIISKFWRCEPNMNVFHVLAEAISYILNE
jgi:hypothetical protein